MFLSITRAYSNQGLEFLVAYDSDVQNQIKSGLNNVLLCFGENLTPEDSIHLFRNLNNFNPNKSYSAIKEIRDYHSKPTFLVLRKVQNDVDIFLLNNENKYTPEKITYLSNKKTQELQYVWEQGDKKELLFNTNKNKISSEQYSLGLINSKLSIIKINPNTIKKIH